MLACSALGVESVAHASAGIDEKAEVESEVFIDAEVLDGLRAAILGQGEVVAGEVGDDGTVLVADGDGHGDHLDVDLQRGCGCILSGLG